MALHLSKKPLTEVVTVPEPVMAPAKVLVEPGSSIEALTGEYIDLHQKSVYFELKQIFKRMDDIKKQLQTIANETMDPKQPAIFVCPQGEVQFSERGTSISVVEPLVLLDALVNKFGLEAAEQVISIAITPLRKLLSEAELTPYVTETLGSRTLKAVRPAK